MEDPDDNDRNPELSNREFLKRFLVWVSASYQHSPLPNANLAVDYFNINPLYSREHDEILRPKSAKINMAVDLTDEGDHILRYDLTRYNPYFEPTPDPDACRNIGAVYRAMIYKLFAAIDTYRMQALHYVEMERPFQARRVKRPKHAVNNLQYDLISAFVDTRTNPDWTFRDTTEQNTYLYKILKGASQHGGWSIPPDFNQWIRQ